MTILDQVNDLVACLCQQITDDGLPPVCYCGPVPGEVAMQDYSGDCTDACGMAWVRVATIYPSVTVGIPDTTLGNCGSGLGFEVEMGVMRCMSVGDEEGNPPTDKEVAEATALQVLDAECMRRAVDCCASLGAKDYILGQYTPLGPEGGLVGGFWNVALAGE